MTAICPRCGASSNDTEFCDYCNADLAPPLVASPPPRIPIPGGEPIPLSPRQLAILGRPETGLEIQAHRRFWRAHWLAEPDWKRFQPAIERRQAVNCVTLPRIQTIVDDGGHWVLAAASGHWAKPWNQKSFPDEIAELGRLLTYLQTLSESLDALRQAGYHWLTFDPYDLELAPGGGGFRIANLDLGLTRVGDCPARVPFNPQFVAPEIARFEADAIGPATDTFHLALAAYYWLSRLLPAGFMGKGLEAFRHKLPPLRVYAPALTPGIWPVIQRGLQLDPRDRHADPKAFCIALQNAVSAALARRNSKRPVTWDSGAHTRTGRAKSSCGRDNEDAVLICDWQDPPRTLAAVADGISTCDVGSGAVASRVTNLILENAFANGVSREQFQEVLSDACKRAASNLLDWAKENGQLPVLQDGGELMGTTLTAVWLEGNTLQIGNLGDSRVYLVTEEHCEQLTVDGDLGSAMLASGVPPEHVEELGTASLGLRSCVGGCDRGANGTVQVGSQYNQPFVGEWRLMPDDVIVLCTDGLVEEGLFLDPSEIHRLISAARDMAATEVAIRLADAADALQRTRSDAEPEGFGDNISCVVIRMMESDQ